MTVSAVAVSWLFWKSPWINDIELLPTFTIAVPISMIPGHFISDIKSNFILAMTNEPSILAIGLSELYNNSTLPVSKKVEKLALLTCPCRSVSQYLILSYVLRG